MSNPEYDPGPQQVHTTDDIHLLAFNQLLQANHELQRQLHRKMMCDTYENRQITELQQKNTDLEIANRELRKRVDTPADTDTAMRLGMDRYAALSAQWVESTFGKSSQTNLAERSFRFLEEALELVQWAGLFKSEVLGVVSHVYDRPKGDIADEVGGVIVTLASLAHNLGVPLGDAAIDTLKSCWLRQGAIREKHDKKPSHIRAGHNNEGDSA